MKIQINSLEALERLIGGDTDIEIQVRNSVVQNFTNKYLRGVAQEYAKNGFLKSLETQISKDVFEKTGTWGNEYKFKDHYKKTAVDLINSIIRDEVQNQLKIIIDSGKIKTYVESAVAYQVTVEVSQIKKSMIEEEAKKQIQEKFK